MKKTVIAVMLVVTSTSALARQDSCHMIRKVNAAGDITEVKSNYLPVEYKVVKKQCPDNRFPGKFDPKKDKIMIDILSKSCSDNIIVFQGQEYLNQMVMANGHKGPYETTKIDKYVAKGQSDFLRTSGRDIIMTDNHTYFLNVFHSDNTRSVYDCIQGDPRSSSKRR